MVDADAPRAFDDAFAALDASYAEDVTDEFVVPCGAGRLCRHGGWRCVAVRQFPRRPGARDFRWRCWTRALTGFARDRVVQFSAAAGMTEYSDELNAMMTAMFPPEDVRETLGEVMAEHHLKQLRIAETEKYAHVTFFLNGGREDPFAGEDRILVPSPKVSTYDHKPEMSAYQVTDKLEEAIGSGKYDLIVANYANPDMVGHTGVMEAAIKAVDTIDECLGRLRAAIEKARRRHAADRRSRQYRDDEGSGDRRAAHRAHHASMCRSSRSARPRARRWKMAAWPMSRPPCWR